MAIYLGDKKIADDATVRFQEYSDTVQVLKGEAWIDWKNINEKPTIIYDPVTDMIKLLNSDGQYYPWKYANLNRIMLYSDGDSFIETTGGWKKVNGGTFVENDGGWLSFKTTNTSYYVTTTKQPIYTNGFTTLKFDYQSFGGGFTIKLLDSANKAITDAVYSKVGEGTGSDIITLSSPVDKINIRVYCSSKSNSAVKLNNIMLTK